MFTFYVYVPHGRGWKRLPNIQANHYKTAARMVHDVTGAKRVKVEGETIAEQSSMGYMTRIVNFEEQS